jgi:hypothetical protein
VVPQACGFQGAGFDFSPSECPSLGANCFPSPRLKLREPLKSSQSIEDHYSRTESKNAVKKITAVILLLLFACTWAGSKTNPTEPNPADYTTTVHVSACHLSFVSVTTLQNLDVVINGKAYELQAASSDGVLALGDYKAKLVQDLHKNAYESSQTYEFLFPDMKVRKFSAIGQTE